MTNEHEQDYSDIRKYLPSIVATKFVNEKNFRAARKTLDALLGKLDTDGKEILTQMVGEDDYSDSREAQADVQNASAIARAIYEKKIGKRKLKDFADIFKDEFLELFEGEQASKARKILEDVDMDYETFTKKIAKAQTRRDEKSGYSKKKRKKAEKFIKKHASAFNLIHQLQEYAVREISSSAYEDAAKEGMRKLVDDYKD